MQKVGLGFLTAGLMGLIFLAYEYPSLNPYSLAVEVEENLIVGAVVSDVELAFPRGDCVAGVVHQCGRSVEAGEFRRNTFRESRASFTRCKLD